jgi:NTP pyrophosphatase (non-canonical NTP hydrolase)
VHGDEYRARKDGLQEGLTVDDLRRQVRELKADKGFDITLEQRLAYLTSEVGEVAQEVLRLSRDGNADAGKMGAEEAASVRENLGEEIYDVVWNLLDLADLAGVDLEGAFEKKARRNEGREW